ncbi:MAM domain-containing glycosylphosphatidylinositol anchor protein 1 GPI and MAM protein [Larimichthys crocea]|uniref:MAM domain-containing glycosylphosphatidylinositol anchor protein 1 GPI and MAM protein n=1 Tax=Larimichthys crocea TaxID=215358 RepID=A0A6G0ICE6_LARCR|nr:MAM domain-containing glycosylphosphatidylinositol anchor protein 1 GPI and MAM protein [Larimichthys crocea]
MIFHTNKNNAKVQSGFRGRVSLLEPDVNQRNCSIIINDLTESDSGSYQLRINGLKYMYTQDGFTFTPRATISVKDLMQKPTLMIPPLTEGKQTTLTCTAPGLCSGSVPQITWTWRGEGENDSHITGNVTAVKNESVTSVAQRYSSTLTFDPSAEHHGTSVTCKVGFRNNITAEETVTLNVTSEHHGTNVTCKVGFRNNITAEETVTLNVTYVKEVKITGNTSVKEGETLNLNCSVESFPPSLVTWTKFSDKNMQNGTKNNLQNDTFTDLQNDTKTYPQEEKTGVVTYSVSNVTAEDSGRYICTAKYLNNTLMENVDVRVIYTKEPVITGRRSLEEGDALNLTCSVESFPPSRITWTILGSNKKLHNESRSYLQSSPGSATLVIHNMAVEHSGKYICTAQHLNTTVAVYADVTVTLFPKILKDSGFNSSITLSVKDGSNATVECVSSNANGEAKKPHNSNRHTRRKGKKQKSSGNLDKTLEMVTTQEDPLIDDDEAVEDDQTYYQEAAEEEEVGGGGGGGGGGAVAAEKAALNLDDGPKDVEYASIDFSMLKRKSKREAAKTQETTETEYAEIKKVKEEREDNDREEGEVEEEAMMAEEAEEIKHDVPEEEEGEDMEVYSNVKDIMNGLTFTPRATISVKDLMQKPTLMIPPLMEGKQTTLTCTAPGLCSGSVPQITWTWRGEGENDSHIIRKVTAFKTSCDWRHTEIQLDFDL